MLNVSLTPRTPLPHLLRSQLPQHLLLIARINSVLSRTPASDPVGQTAAAHAHLVPLWTCPFGRDIIGANTHPLIAQLTRFLIFHGAVDTLVTRGIHLLLLATPTADDILASILFDGSFRDGNAAAFGRPLGGILNGGQDQLIEALVAVRVIAGAADGAFDVL